MQVLTVAASDRSNKTSKAQRSEPDGTKVMKNNQIGTIASWGPTFRVAVDIFIHSYGPYGWQNILRFTNTNHKINQMGDTIPAIFYHSRYSFLTIASPVDIDANKAPAFTIDKEKWYHIEIAQTKWDGEVSEIHNFSLLM